MLTMVQHHMHHPRMSSLRAIFAAVSIKMFGLSIFSVFIPIYLYTLNYSFRMIIIFFLMDHLFRTLLTPFEGWLISKMGPIFGLAVSAGVNVFMLLLLYTLPQHSWPLALVAFASAVATSMHFLSYFVDFAVSQKIGKTGREVGALAQLLIIVTSLGPLLGGLIGTFYGTAWLLATTIALVALSMVPLLSAHHPHVSHDFDIRRIPWCAMTPDLISAGGKAWDNRAAGVVWPFAIFLLVGTYAKVGFITAISFLTVFVVARLVTVRADSEGPKLLKTGSFASAGIHLVRIIAQTFVSVVFVNLLDGIFNWVCQIPWQAKMYRNALATSPVEYLTAFNIAADASAVIFWTILLASTYILSVNQTIILAFLLGAIGMTIVPIISRSRIITPVGASDLLAGR
jgi:MFS family permease